METDDVVVGPAEAAELQRADAIEGTGEAASDPAAEYDGGWEEATEEGHGFEDHLLGEAPTIPEV